MYGQTEQDPYISITDRFGNLYQGSDLKVPEEGTNFQGGGCTCNAGIFVLFFQDQGQSTGIGFDEATINPDTGNELGADRRATICRVFSDLSVLLDPDGAATTSVNIEVRVSGNGAGTNVIATGSSFYLVPYAVQDGFVVGEAWKTIISDMDSYIDMALVSTVVSGVNNNPPPSFHGYIQVNFNPSNQKNYHLDYTTNTANNEMDFYTLTLHEALHILGIASLIDANGNSRLTGFTSVYEHYDSFLNTASDDIIALSNCYETSFDVNTSDLSAACGNVPINFTGNNVAAGQLVFNDVPFLEGSSLSHFNCVSSSGSCPSDYQTDELIMNVCMETGSNWQQRYPGQTEYYALCDLGYDIGTYFGAGPTLKTYTACNQSCTIAGNNDFRHQNGDLYQLDYLNGTSDPINNFEITIDNVLDNDYPPGGNKTISCLELMQPAMGTLINITNTGFTFKGNTNTNGWAVIRYRPACADGTQGNMTYVFVFVNPPPLPECPASDCNLICNGDFEAFENAILNPLSNFGGPDYINTPDLFSTVPIQGATQGSVPGTQQNFFSGLCDFQSFSPMPNNFPNNTKYMGFHSSTPEAIYFPLQSALQPNQTYRFQCFRSSRCTNSILNLLFTAEPPCKNAPMNFAVPKSFDCGDGTTFETFDDASFQISFPNVTNGTEESPGWNLVTFDFTITDAALTGLDNLSIYLDDNNSFYDVYEYYDDLSLFLLNDLELNINAISNNLSPCIDQNETITIDYLICLDPNAPASIDNNAGIQLNIPSEFIINTTTSVFDATGLYNISNMAPDDCINLTLELSMDDNSIILGTDYTLIADIISDIACMDVNLSSGNSVTISPQGTELDLSKTGTFDAATQTVQYIINISNPDVFTAVNNITIEDILDPNFYDMNTFNDPNGNLTLNGNIIINNTPFNLPADGGSTQFSFRIALAQGVDPCDVQNCVHILLGEGVCHVGQDVCTDLLPQTMQPCCPDESDFSLIPPPAVICEGDLDIYLETEGIGAYVNQAIIVVERTSKFGTSTTNLWPTEPITPGNGFFIRDATYTIYYELLGFNDCPGFEGPHYTFEIISDECCEELTCCTDEVANTYLPPPDFSSINEPKIGWSYNSNPWNITSGPIRLNGIFYIPPDKHLYINNMSFEMGPKAKIVIAPSALLELNDCTISGDPVCETMWHGIRVLGPGMGVIANESNAGQLFVNGGRIEDALVGIAGSFYGVPLTFDEYENEAAGFLYVPISPVPSILNNDISFNVGSVESVINGMASQSQGRIVINNALIKNCFTGIDLSKHEMTNNDFASSISHTTFEVDNTMYQPFNPIDRRITGLIAFNAEDINVVDCTFRNIHHGIYTDRCTKQDFKNNVFEDCKVGLAVVGDAGNINNYNNNFITNNMFNKCQTAIQCINHSVHIEGNDINVNTSLVTNAGIYLFGNHFNLQSNRIKNTKHGIVLHNNMNGLPSSNWLLDPRDNSITDVTNNIVWNNKARSTQNGVLAIDNNTSIQLTCNQFSLYETAGINLVATSTTATPVLADQGGCDAFNDKYPTGNLFGETDVWALLVGNNVGTFKYFRSNQNSLINNITSNQPTFITTCGIDVGDNFCGIGTIDNF